MRIEAHQILHLNVTAAVYGNRIIILFINRRAKKRKRKCFNLQGCFLYVIITEQNQTSNTIKNKTPIMSATQDTHSSASFYFDFMDLFEC